MDGPVHLSIPFCGWSAVDLFVLVTSESPFVAIQIFELPEKREGKYKDFYLIMKNLSEKTKQKFCYF